jgi:hypothetical protein
LTLDGAVFFAGADLRPAVLAATFFLFTGLLAIFLAARSVLAGLRDADLAAGARFALAFTALALALTGHFAVFADAPRPVERGADRRRPFVRLLLICRPRMAAVQGFSSR